MKLNDIRDNPGAHKKKMVVGRGIGSGKGKTSGRGVKGQKARTGVRLGGFEGGQMPLHRRLPKRGFSPLFPKDYAELNLDRLQSAIDAGTLDAKNELNVEALVKARVVAKSKDGVRLLGKGSIKAKVQISVAGASKSAIEAIEKAGGKVTIVVPKEPANQTAQKAKKAAKAKAAG